MLRLLLLFGLGFRGLFGLGILILAIVTILYSFMNGFSLVSAGIIVVCIWLGWKVLRRKRTANL